MKKVLTIVGLMAVGTLLHGQGVVVFNSNNLGVLTNTAVSQFSGGTQTGGVSGKTAITANGFQYALLIQSYTGALSLSATNPTTGGWNLALSSGVGVIGVNGPSAPQQGGIIGPGTTGGVAVDGWALPTAGTYDTAGHEYFMVAGWSSNLGTWAQVQAQLTSGIWNANGFFGVSKIGDSYAGGANAKAKSK